MDISIFGLGYVGAVCAACLVRRGHAVIGCDVQDNKVGAINDGSSPIQEPGLSELMRQGHEAGLLSATLDAGQAVARSGISLICVGTPGRPNGDIETKYLLGVCKRIGQIVKDLDRPHSVVIRSTILPDYLDEEVIPALREAAGPRFDELLRVCVNPEFLREGSAIADFESPPLILIGERRPGDGDVLAEMYQGVKAQIVRTGIKEAVMVKYACNIFHALKIIFGNEIGSLCQAGGIDSHQVMDAFCQDRQLNISHRYLKPGYAFGGSCLPKDLKAMLHFARRRDIESPMLAGIAASNKRHIERCVQAILATGARQVAVLGLSFKDDTDDLRQSPTVEIVERLLGKGVEVRIHDSDVSASRIFGSNLSFIQEHLPHLARLIRPTVAEALQGAQAVVLAKPSKAYRNVEELLVPEQTLLDLIRLFDPKTFSACRYVGLVG